LTIATSRAEVNRQGAGALSRTVNGTAEVSMETDGISIEGAGSGEDISDIDGGRAGAARSSVISVARETATGSEIISGSVSTVGSS
jgi:hypothetical protein